MKEILLRLRCCKDFCSEVEASSGIWFLYSHVFFSFHEIRIRELQISRI